MLKKRPPVDKRSVSKRDFDRLPKFQEGGFAVLNRVLPSEQKKIEETAKYYDTYNELVNKYNQSLKDYEDQYNAATEAYNLRAKDYETRYNTETDRYNKALEDYNRQVGLFQTQQVDPYNAALTQYQRDQEAYAKAYQDYLDQYSVAEQAYQTQYSDYEKQYQDYLNQYSKYEATLPEYQKRLDEYQNTYDATFKKYEQEVDAYNKAWQDYQNTYVMARPDAYRTMMLGGRGNILQNVENMGGDFVGTIDAYKNPSLMYTYVPGSDRLYLQRQNPTVSRALELRRGPNNTWNYVDPVSGAILHSEWGKGAASQMPGFAKRAQPNYYISGFSPSALTIHYFNEPTASAPNAPAFAPPAHTVAEPSFTVQAPTPNLPQFTAREPSFTQKEPVFSLQQPTFAFNEAAPTFQFNQQQPQRPKDPEMTPEQLQAYQERAQKLAGYRASGLEKAFEMGIAPEIAQYFKRGIM
jgi:hypothetical protein